MKCKIVIHNDLRRQFVDSLHSHLRAPKLIGISAGLAYFVCDLTEEDIVYLKLKLPGIEIDRLTVVDIKPKPEQQLYAC